MRKLLYILPVLLILGFAACENYVDITPTGKKTVDSTETYYELVALPNRSYYPSSFALLSDNVWSKESNIIGKEYLSSDGINMTFNEDADRKELSDNNLYANCYQYILRSNIVISLVDHSTGDKDVKELAKAEAKIMRAWDHFILVNTFAKAYNPETAATDGGIAIVSEYDLEATPTKATVAQVYDFIIKDIEDALPYLQEEPVDNPAYTYGMISPELVQLFGDNDERLNLFFKTTGNLEYYFDEGSGAALWNTALTYSKFQYMAVGMRTAEVYLILAEANARLNDLSGAVKVLNLLREKRIKGSEAVLPEPATQREMMQEIINERRKELLFGFSRFWDLKRFNTEADYEKTITRTFPLVTTTVEQKIYTLKPDSRLYIIPFPVAAREKNPNLTLNTNE